MQKRQSLTWRSGSLYPPAQPWPNIVLSISVRLRVTLLRWHARVCPINISWLNPCPCSPCVLPATAVLFILRLEILDARLLLTWSKTGSDGPFAKLQLFECPLIYVPGILYPVESEGTRSHAK